MALDKPTGQPQPMQPGEWKGASVPNQVSFKYKDVDPPSPLYIQRDDTLFLSAISTVTAASITITARLWLAAEGRITTIQAVLQLPTAYQLQSLSIPLAEGYLLSVTLSNFPSAIAHSNYATITINRGPGVYPLAAPGALLFAGYLVGTLSYGWPESGVNPPLSGVGNRRVFTLANPAAGTDWQFITTNANTMYELLYFNAVLTTSAAVANRNVQLLLDDGVTVNFVSAASATIAASLTANVSGSQENMTSLVVPTDVSVVVPPRNLFNPTDRIRSSTQNIQAGDQWSAIRFVVREWLHLQ